MSEAAIRRALAALMLAGLIVHSTRPALAADTTTVVHPGITYIKRILSSQRIHILKIDLSLKTIRLHATKPPGGMRTSSFASASGCAVAVNGDFGTRSAPWHTSGLSMGDGVVWPNTSDNATEGFTAIGRDNKVVLSQPPAVLKKPEAWMAEIVGGRPMIVDLGVARDAVAPYATDGCGPHFCTLQPRTAFGLSKDGKTMIWAVVEGRKSPVAVGMTTKQLGVLMQGLGAWTAMNQDGGGSSTLYIKKLGGVVSDADPTEGERTVSNHLGASLVEATGTLKGFVRDTNPSDAKAGIAGATVKLSTGPSATSDASGAFQFTKVPSGPMTVTASQTGYTTAQKSVTVFSADTVSTVIVLVKPGVDAGGTGDPDGGNGEWTDGSVDPEAGLPDLEDAGPWSSSDESVDGGGSASPTGGCGCVLGQSTISTFGSLLAIALGALLWRAFRRRR